MTKKNFSLLSFKPDWRHKEALSLQSTELIDDPVIRRYVTAKLNKFENDEELVAIVNMSPEDRGLIEALYLGGANLDQIAKYTMTQRNSVQLVLDLFFDVGAVRTSPLLRTQIALRDSNRTSKSYKVFAAKNGWKDFLKQFFSLEEIMEDAPTISQTRTNLMVELTRKIRELSIYETGTPQSRELQVWMKLLLELTREMRLHEIDEGPVEDADIKMVMAHLRNNKNVSKDPAQFSYVPPMEDLKEEGKNES